MSKRRLKRERELVEVVEEVVELANEDTQLKNTADADLFTMDFEGSKTARRKIDKIVKKQEAGTLVVSKTEQVLLERHAVTVSTSSSSSSSKKVEKTKLVDLWGDLDVLPSKKQTALKPTRSRRPTDVLVNGVDADTVVGVAIPGKREYKGNADTKRVLLNSIVPGSSYNPSQKDHQDALRKAVAVEEANEVKRQEKKRDVDVEMLLALEAKAAKALNKKADKAALKAGISTSNDGKTMVVTSSGRGGKLLREANNATTSSANSEKVQGYHSDESEDEEEEDGGFDSDSDGDGGSGDDATGTRLLSRRERRLTSKLTKTERNKMAAKKRRLAEERESARERRLIGQISQLGTVVKTLRKKEEEQAIRRKELEDIKTATRAEELKAVPDEEALAIPLSDELGGSLRRLRPKGNAIDLQVTKMRAANNAALRDRRNRRMHEKPHGPKNVKWHAKHKYV